MDLTKDLISKPDDPLGESQMTKQEDIKFSCEICGSGSVVIVARSCLRTGP